MSLGNNNDYTVTIHTEADTTGVTKTQEELRQLKTTTDQTQEPTEGLNKKFSGLADSIRSVGSVIAGYGLLQSFKAFGEYAFGGAGDLEQANVSFHNLIGNAQEANQIFAQLVQYANQTPFETKDIEAAAKQLMSFGVEGKNTVGLIKQLGDVTAAGGGDLQALSLVTGQVFAQGKMRAQDMYQVINDGGAGLIQIMAKNAGGMQNLTAEFDKGGIPAQQYFDAVKEASSKGGFAFEGAQKQAQTFNGMISTLKDSMQQFAMKIVGVHFDPQLGLVIDKGGLFDKAKGIVEGITNALTELAKHKTAVEMIAGAIGGVFLGAVIAVMVAIGWVPLAIIGISAAVGAMVTFCVAKWKEWHDWIMVGGVLLFGLIGIIAIVVGEIIAHWSKVTAFFAQAWSDIKQWAQDTANFVVGLWQGVGNFFRSIISAISNFFGGLWGSIKGGFDNAYHGMMGWAGKVCDDIVAFFKNLPARITGAIGNVSDRVAGDIKGAFHSMHIPGFATGVSNYGGGLAVVGENGPELVNLPRGSSVYTNTQSQGMLQGGSSSTTYNIAKVELSTDAAVRTFFEINDRNGLLASKGMSIVRP